MPSGNRQNRRQRAGTGEAMPTPSGNDDDALKVDFAQLHDEAAALAAIKTAINAKRTRGRPVCVILQGQYKAQFGAPYRGEHETLGRKFDRARQNGTIAQSTEASVRVCVSAIEKRGERVTHAAVAAQWARSWPTAQQPTQATVRRTLTKIRAKS